jgi:hypothetical protein
MFERFRVKMLWQEHGRRRFPLRFAPALEIGATKEHGSAMLL